MRPTFRELPPMASRPEILTPSTYSHPLQERIANEWRPLLLENGEGCPSRRLDVFKERVDKFKDLTDGLTPDELDGEADPEVTKKVARYATYIKASAIDVVTPLKINVGSFVDKKMMETMQEKYPADSVYSLIQSGVTPLETMSYLKNLFNQGEHHIPRDYPFLDGEWEYRIPRDPPFKDAYQDVADIWQRRSFGLYLRASERLPNLFGEADEFIDEFKEMSDSEINSLALNSRIVNADDEVEEGDLFHKKLMSIGGEAGDVVIGVDGYASGLDRDQKEDSKIAVDRMIAKYRKTKKLVGLGLPEAEALRLQHEVEYRKSRGLKLPYINIPAAAAILLG